MSRIESEKETVRIMVGMYCRGNHGRELCKECSALLEYSLERLDSCMFGEVKGSCKSCEVHCYREPERAMMRKVMRYSGPRMLLRHPGRALRHMLRR